MMYRKGVAMPQLNIHVTPEFAENLRRFMGLRGLRTKSEAVRVAVHESLEREQRASCPSQFGSWRGMAVSSPLEPKPRFASDDDLWR